MSLKNEKFDGEIILLKRKPQYDELPIQDGETEMGYEVEEAGVFINGIH